MSIPSFSLEGKVALITGARRGIGRGIALAFAEAGADVAICDIVVEGGEMEAVTGEIRQLGRRSLAVQTDITQKAQVDNLVQGVEDELGAIDILVNNAAILLITPLLGTSEEDWDKVIDTNLKGYYLCSQAVGRRMVQQKRGNIINIASTDAFYLDRSYTPYGAAKAGVVRLTRGMAMELGSYNIRVNAIAPGWVRTKMTEFVWSAPEFLKRAEAEIPLERMAEPSEIANVALFLASDLSSYITGATIFVDGGLIA